MSRSQLSSTLIGVDRLRELSARLPSEGTEPGSVSVPALMQALGSFSEIVRYLNTRRSSGAILELTSEAAVQDALYLMLRPWILDLVPENPTDKIANRYSIKDFVSQSNRFVIEAKYVRSPDHGKSLVKELNDDIETYRYHAFCDDLIFFIYDPDANIPDAGAVERHLRTNRSYDGKILRCHGIIKP